MAAPSEDNFEAPILDLERRILVRDHSQGPPGRVGSGVLGAAGEYFRGGGVLVAGAEGTEPAARFPADGTMEIGGPVHPVARDDYPATENGVLAKLGHAVPPSPCLQVQETAC